MKSEIRNYSEPVVMVFKLVGRQEPKNPGEGHGQTRFDLLIQPLMVREGSDGDDQGMAAGLAKKASHVLSGLEPQASPANSREAQD